MWLGVSISAISNQNNIRSVLQLMRGWYRAAGDKSMKNHGVCVVPCPPELPGLPTNLCCNWPVHPDCLWSAGAKVTISTLYCLIVITTKVTTYLYIIQ